MLTNSTADYKPITASQTYTTSPDTCARHDEDETACNVNTLQAEYDILGGQELRIMTDIQHVEQMLEQRCLKLAKVCQSQAAVERQIRDLTKSSRGADPKAPLDWVSSATFEVLCVAIVFGNLVCIAMAAGSEGQEHHSIQQLNNIFLVWYIVELALRIAHLRLDFFCGPLYVVCWMWMDIVNVASGLFESWVLLNVSHPNQNHPDLQALRTLRLLRVLKIIRLLVSDMSWAESNAFQFFMAAVIAWNSLTMAMELDIAGPGWFWVENCILIIYIFELYVRISNLGLAVFFVSGDDVGWNRMDALIVFCALLDQWLVPMLQSMLLVPNADTTSPPFLQVARLLRMARILRLVRLLRSIKPLYRLLLGVKKTMESVKWVLVLAMIILYAGAILFTLLVGHGVIFNGDPPEAAVTNFGTVPQSMFMLFKLMNDDQSVVDFLDGNLTGEALFVGFMMISNWALLALLTSVVSGDVIQVYQDEEAREVIEMRDAQIQQKTSRIMTCFRQYDPNWTGVIDADSFNELLEDPVWGSELVAASGASTHKLFDLFQALAYPTADQRFVLQYDGFTSNFDSETERATERTSLHILNRLNRLEYQLTFMFQEVTLSTQLETLPQQGTCIEQFPQEACRDTKRRPSVPLTGSQFARFYGRV